MRWALPVLLFSGCGRVGFDPPSDATLVTGHDEDGDGIADANDFCPHVAGANGDSDGDGVGDICDPDPATPSQHWIAFSPMVGDDNTINTAGVTWTMGPDSWDFVDAANPNNLLRTDDVANVDVWVGVDVTAVTSAGRQLAIIIRDNGNNPYFYGELFDSGQTTSVNIINFDGTSYNSIASQSYPGFPNGQAVTLHLQARTSPPTFTMFADTRMATAATAGYAGGTYLLIGTGNCSGSIRYLAIIGS